MATDKKSFVLYCDYKEIFNELSDADAGQLIKHIMDYVNDENPVSENPFVKLSFIPIKSQLKRDLVKYEDKKQQWSEAGKASAEKKRLQKEANERATISTSVDSVATDSTVNDNVTVTVNDNVTVTDSVIEKKIINNREKAIALTLERKKKFYNSLIPFLNQYPKETIKAFYDYWSELNKSETKMLWEFKPTFELSKRLATWNARDKNTSKPYQSEGDKRREDAANLSTMARHVVQNAVVDLSKI